MIQNQSILASPKDYDGKNTIEKENEKFAKFGNVLWFTNLPCVKRKEQLKLEKEYKPEKYLNMIIIAL